jgi:hypothetical protein
LSTDGDGGGGGVGGVPMVAAAQQHNNQHDNQKDSQHGGGIIEWRERNYVQNYVFFSVQVCLDPWTVLRQADLQRYLFWGRKGMFLCFYVQKIVPVDTL